MKKTWIGLAVVAALVAATIGWSGQAPAQTKTDTPSASVPSGAPEKIEGTVTAIDARNGMVDQAGPRQHHAALDHVLELTDVARPRVTLQPPERLVGEAFESPVVLGRIEAQEVLGEHADVLAALAQRRHGDRDDVEPIEEVLAEAPVPHHLGQVLIGGGDDANVHAHRAGAPEPLELTFLEDSQNLRLGHRREIGEIGRASCRG